MNIEDVNSRTLNEICRMLKRRRAEDGFSYRTRHAGRNEPNDPSTWSLPIHHGPAWITSLSIVRYLQAFPRYRDVLAQFDIDPRSVFSREDGMA